jgi:hypothetical protein
MDQINELKDAYIEHRAMTSDTEKIKDLKEFLKDLICEMIKLKKHQSQHIEGRNNMIRLCNLMMK